MQALALVDLDWKPPTRLARGETKGKKGGEAGIVRADRAKDRGDRPAEKRNTHLQRFETYGS